MSIRDDVHAIERGAGKARPGAALMPRGMLFGILGGLLLLSAP
jgi:hypothetical protein